MWEIASGMLPWDDCEDCPFLCEALLRRIRAGERPPRPPCDDAYAALMERCWATEAAMRPAFDAIVSDPCFARARSTLLMDAPETGSES